MSTDRRSIKWYDGHLGHFRDAPIAASRRVRLYAITDRHRSFTGVQGASRMDQCGQRWPYLAKVMAGAADCSLRAPRQGRAELPAPTPPRLRVVSSDETSGPSCVPIAEGACQPSQLHATCILVFFGTQSQLLIVRQHSRQRYGSSEPCLPRHTASVSFRCTSVPVVGIHPILGGRVMVWSWLTRAQAPVFRHCYACRRGHLRQRWLWKNRWRLVGK
jgi:hypothetical protein